MHYYIKKVTIQDQCMEGEPESLLNKAGGAG